MPITSAAKKAMRLTKVHEKRNRKRKEVIKNLIKDFVVKKTKTGLSAAFSALDKAVKKGLIKKNTAARKKSQLTKKLSTKK
jgi:ribosomal protein S20